MWSSRTEFTMTVRRRNNSPPFSFHYSILPSYVLSNCNIWGKGFYLILAMIFWAVPFDLFWCGGEKASAEGFWDGLKNSRPVPARPWQSCAGEQMSAFLPLLFTAQIPFSIPVPQKLLHQCPMPAQSWRYTTRFGQERPPMGSTGMLMFLTSTNLHKHLEPGPQACKPDFSGCLGTEKESWVLFNFKDQSLTLSSCK